MRNAAPTFAVTAILLSLAGLEAATANHHSFTMPGLRQAAKTATSSRRVIGRLAALAGRFTAVATVASILGASVIPE